jgi:diguanylate cyclase (GGDEF)-like protein
MTVFNQPKRKLACLVQYSGAARGKSYILDAAEMVIGRSPKVDIVINEQSVSRSHAKCLQTVDSFDIEDMGSSNGTFLNNQRLSGRYTLKDGDIVRLGTILFKYYDHHNIEMLIVDDLYRMANIDNGTQIANKKNLIESLESEFKYSKTYARALSVIYFDLDHFKKQNDTYGHNAGDYILKDTAQLVKSVIRKEDIFGRFGGEEFVIILPNTDAKTAYAFAERVRSTIENHDFVFEGKTMKQTISLGVSQVNPDMKEPKDLLEDADKKLYQSKTKGRNRVTI